MLIAKSHEQVEQSVTVNDEALAGIAVAGIVGQQAANVAVRPTRQIPGIFRLDACGPGRCTRYRSAGIAPVHHLSGGIRGRSSIETGWSTWNQGIVDVTVCVTESACDRPITSYAER